MSPFGTYTADAGAAPEPESRYVQGEEIFLPPASDTAGVVVNERTAITFPALLAVLNVVAPDMAMLPCRVYQQEAGGGRRLATEHVVDDLLNVSPDGETTAMSWREALVGEALLHGSGYAEIVRKGARPASLHLLAAATTRPVRDSKKRLWYEIAGGESLPASKVFHLAGLGDDGISGWSFVRLIRKAIGVGLAEEAYQGDFFANGSDPGGVIEMPGAIKDRAKRKQFLEDFNVRHAGVGKRHKTALLEEGAKYNPTGVDPEKSQLLEARRYQLLEVARPWRVPPHKVGDYSQAHLANLEASNQDYLNTALMQWIVRFEQQAALKLFSPAERKAGFYVEHTVEALLRGNLLARYQAYEIAIRNGWISRDEVRRKENMAPIGEAKGGGKYTVQLNLTDLAKVGEPRVARPASQAAPPAEEPPADPAPESTPEASPKTDDA